ncbi:hypothetical protein HD597_006819 [Nonomuraea thailandensis]|uniref:Uncharacterized protein n=1 Tax=Nonomuraea thailandensis TaxID=1188745 RepID=A0A9X2K4T8_9ACTN|nr:hypothetical protein [Nonomuraea thailandensis]MCP2359799.1 hypothetical protein [Nonomuraea thailandensis]
MTGQQRVRETFRLGFYAWNVTAAMRIVEGREPDCIQVERAAALLWLVYVNKAHAATVDLTRPLILVPFEGTGNIPIDGWHRIWKARREGIETLPALALTSEEEFRVRMHGGDKGPGYLR